MARLTAFHAGTQSGMSTVPAVGPGPALRRRIPLLDAPGYARSSVRLGLGVAVLLSMAACNLVLGFESASEDPLSVGNGGKDGGSEDGDVPQTLCEELCTTVLTACPADDPQGSLAVYDAQLTCERQCALFPEGEAGDEQGNSAHCRLSHAKIARDFPGERANACPAAGPGGDGICGSNCEGYCTLLQAECGTFDSAEKCAEACSGVPDTGGFDISITSGDSVQCRLYHLQAAVVSPLNHCPHAAGAFPCTDGTR